MTCQKHFETINLRCWWWCFCGGNAAPPVALTTLPHCHYFLVAFCHKNKNNQPAAVFYGGRIIVFTWKHACYHMPLLPGWFYFLFLRQGNRHHCRIMSIKLASSGSCGSQFLGAGGSWCPEAGDIWRLVAVGMPPLGLWYTAATRLILFFVFATRQQMPPRKKQQSNMSCLEAVAVGFQKLVAVSVQKVVASGCWWQWDATTMAGLTVLIFCTPRQACYHRLLPPGWLLIFCFCSRATDATATMVIVKCFSLQRTPLLLLLVDCSFFVPESMWVVVAWLIVFVVFLARQQATTKNHGHCCIHHLDWDFFSWNGTVAWSLLPIACSLLHGQCLLCSGAK